jgi:hypothetical protein
MSGARHRTGLEGLGSAGERSAEGTVTARNTHHIRTTLLAIGIPLVTTACWSSDPTDASTRRPPTQSERKAIVRPLRASFRNTPLNCLRFDVVAVSRGYALAGPDVRPESRCSRYRSNGFFILKEHDQRWEIVYNGSDPPPCSLGIPDEVIPAGMGGCLQD